MDEVFDVNININKTSFSMKNTIVVRHNHYNDKQILLEMSNLTTLHYGKENNTI